MTSAQTGPASSQGGAESVTPIVRSAASWAWRLGAIAVFGYFLAVVVARMQSVVVPVALALLGAALLAPVVGWLARHGLPRAVAVVLALVLALGALAAILSFVVERVITGMPQLAVQVTASIKQVQQWITNGPFHVRQDQIDSVSNSLVNAVQKNQDVLTSGALTTAATAGEVLTGVLLTLFTLAFFLYDGAGIWEFVTRIVPRAHRTKLRTAGRLGFRSLIGYVRATVAVAAVDGICIGVALMIMGVPLALPLGSLVFVGAFVPIIGAVATGGVAVLVALVAKGPVIALITLGVIVAVMQLEGHVLQPLLLGRAVKLHPLAVVLSIASGVVIAGIIGALLAVPIIAVGNTVIRSLLSDDDQAVESDAAPRPPGDGGEDAEADPEPAR